MGRGRTAGWIGVGLGAWCGAVCAAGPVEHAVSAGPLSVRVRIDSSTITVAQRTRMTVTTEVRNGASVTWPPIGEELGGFTVVSCAGGPPRMLADGAVEQERILTLEPFLAGEYEIPPLEFTCRPLQGPQTTLRTQAVTITVASVLGDAEPEVAPARGEIVEGGGVLRPALVGLGALAIAGFGALVVVRARRRPAAGAPPTPSPETALAEIAGEGGGAAAMARLGPLVRAMLAEDAVPGAARLATDELLQCGALGSLPLLDASNLCKALTESDEARFGSLTPQETRVRAAAAEALAAVRIIRSRQSTQGGGR